HPLDNGRAVLLHRDLEAMQEELGADGRRWRAFFDGPVRHWDLLAAMLLGPWPRPRHPLALAGFGVRALWPASVLARAVFRTCEGRALFAGLAAHAIQPLEWPL